MATDCSSFSTASKQILPLFWSAGDVDKLKGDLFQRLSGTDLTVQSCAGLPDADRASWGSFFTTTAKFCKEPTGFWSAASQATMTQQYEAELCMWQLKLQDAKCVLSEPVFNPQPAEPPGSNALKWFALAVIVVAGAYITHEVASTVRVFVPSKSPPELPPASAVAKERRVRRRRRVS